MQNKYSATKIGLYFTLFCLLPYLYYLNPFSYLSVLTGFPIISVIPIGSPIELFFSLFTGSEDNTILIFSVILTLIFLIAFSVFLIFRNFKNQILKYGFISYSSFLKFLTLQFFLVHPLFFYLYVSLDCKQADFLEMLYLTIHTYPISGLSFLIYGIVVDYMRSKYWIKK